MDTAIEGEGFYEYSYQPKRRYGHSNPGHQGIATELAAGLARYEVTLRQFAEFCDELALVKKDAEPERPDLPNWANGFLPGLDAIALYGMVATRKPTVYCEIGSGNSTKFAALAKARHSPQTRIISVDPTPRAEIDDLAETIIRKPLQDCPPATFAQLRAGDIVFLDGSHRVLQNSDVTVFFLEILPSLPSGVLIQIHDICWPSDYPEPFLKRLYSEQYMLGMILLYAPHSVEILLPNAYISAQPPLILLFQELWAQAPFIERHGHSFWFRKV